MLLQHPGSPLLFRILPQSVKSSDHTDDTVRSNWDPIVTWLPAKAPVIPTMRDISFVRLEASRA
jgi:hypothetical protein